MVVNQNSTNSVQLGNYYCEKRQVPPQNLLRASWAGGNIAWQKSDFQSVILNPLLAMLSARQLTNQIDYVLLCMDFPYRVNGARPTAPTAPPRRSSTASRPDDPPGPGIAGSCSLPNASSNSYAGSECLFRSIAPGTSRTNFLAVMLTASNLAQAKLVIDRAVASDSTFPTQTVYLAKSDGRVPQHPLLRSSTTPSSIRGCAAIARCSAPTSTGPITSVRYSGYQNG